MVGIQGIGGVPEPKPERPTNVREKSPAVSESTSSSQDDVKISSEAQAAATVAKALQAASSEPDIRIDRVEAAKAAIERGDYRKPEVVAAVADHVSKYL